MQLKVSHRYMAQKSSTKSRLVTTSLLYNDIPDPFSFQHHFYNENDVTFDCFKKSPTPHQKSLSDSFSLEEHCLDLSKKNLSTQEDDLFANYTFFDNLEKDFLLSNIASDEKTVGLALCNKKTTKPSQANLKHDQNKLIASTQMQQDNGRLLEDSLGLWLESFYIDSEKSLQEAKTAAMFQKMIMKQLFRSRKARGSVSKKHRKKLIQKSLVSEFHKTSDGLVPLVCNIKDPHYRHGTKITANSSFPMILNGIFKGTLDKRCLKCMFYNKRHGKRVRQSELHFKRGQTSLGYACLCQSMTIKPSRLKYS